jgi:hypothetical protein
MLHHSNGACSVRIRSLKGFTAAKDRKKGEKEAYMIYINPERVDRRHI